MLFRSGMSRVNRVPVSLERSYGKLVGFTKDISGIYSDDTAIAVSGVIRFPGGRAGTSHGLRIVSKDPTVNAVTLYHRRNEGESWKTFGPVTPDKGGFCDWLITNYEMQVHIETDISGSTATIEGAALMYDMDQRLGLKGLI